MYVHMHSFPVLTKMTKFFRTIIVTVSYTSLKHGSLMACLLTSKNWLCWLLISHLYQWRYVLVFLHAGRPVKYYALCVRNLQWHTFTKKDLHNCPRINLRWVAVYCNSGNFRVRKFRAKNFRVKILSWLTMAHKNILTTKKLHAQNFSLD